MFSVQRLYLFYIPVELNLCLFTNGLLYKEEGNGWLDIVNSEHTIKYSQCVTCFQLTWLYPLFPNMIS